MWEIVVNTFETQVLVLHQVFKHEKTFEAKCFYCFECLESPMKSDTHMFQITSQTNVFHNKSTVLCLFVLKCLQFPVTHDTHVFQIPVTS